MEDYLPLIIQLIAGTVGAAVANLPRTSGQLGAVGVLVTGIVGGVVVGQVAHVLVIGGSDGPERPLDFAPLIADLLGGFFGGAAVALVAGLVKRMAMRG